MLPFLVLMSVTSNLTRKRSLLEDFGIQPILHLLSWRRVLLTVQEVRKGPNLVVVSVGGLARIAAIIKSMPLLELSDCIFVKHVTQCYLVCRRL